MTEPRQIAVVRDYPALLEALRQRAVELRVTRKQIAEIAGIAEGYAGTLLTPHSRKSFGLNSMGPLLGALGIQLVVQEDKEALEAVKNRLGDANEAYARNGAMRAPVIFKFSKMHMAKLGRKGARARKRLPKARRRAMARKAVRALNESLSPQQRVDSAKHAAKARWHKPEIVEIAETCQERGNAPLIVKNIAISPGKTAQSQTKPIAKRRRNQK